MLTGSILLGILVGVVVALLAGGVVYANGRRTL
jgi:hypothetical protein